MSISSSRQTAKTLYRLLHDGGCSEKDFVYELHEWRKQVEEAQRKKCAKEAGMAITLDSHIPGNYDGAYIIKAILDAKGDDMAETKIGMIVVRSSKKTIGGETMSIPTDEIAVDMLINCSYVGNPTKPLVFDRKAMKEVFGRLRESIEQEQRKLCAKAFNGRKATFFMSAGAISDVERAILNAGKED